MSGREFVSTLGLLGYPRVKALDSASLDWLFEDHMAPFLSWFCHSLTASNALSEEELEQFAALQESGEGLLSGDQLENVLQTLNPFPDDATPVTKASLKEEISRLAEDVKTYQLRKDTLIQQRNQLSTHLTQQTKAASQADSCQAAGKQEYREALEQSQADNNTRNESDLRLVKCVNAISGLYEKSAQQQQQQDEAVFLSQLELKSIQKLEEKYSQEVTNYSKKQFFEGIAEMTGQTEGSRYEMLEISDPKCLLLQGETSEKNIKYSRELSRLKNIYPHSEQLRIDSAVGKARHKSANEEAETVLRSLQAKPMSDSAHSLSAQLEELKSGQQTVKRDIADQTEDIIPGLIMQNAASQVLPIITGDYNLKIARQDYFTSNQDQLIGQLVVQRARNEFLSMAYEVESRNHRDVHRLLTAVHSQLCSQETDLQQRLELMEDPGLTTAKYQRGTIDSRDGSAQRLHAVLVPNPDDGHALYQKFASLVCGAEQLCEQSSATQASLATVFTQHKEHLVQLQRLLAQCEGLVYSESSGSVGQPVLTPQPLLTAHTTLSRLLNQIEQTVMDVIKQVDQKKKVLRGDPLVRTEREIMEMFLVTPEKLGALLEQMTQRIQAQRVK